MNKDLKIVDFGLSNIYEVKGKDTLKTAWGSPWYAAPEMIAGKRYHGDKVDVWSLGIVLFAMVCGYLPFEDPVTKKLYKKIVNADYKIPKYVSHSVKDLMVNIINTNPDDRFTIDDIIAHPWFQRVNSFPWPLSSLSGDISRSDKEEYYSSETSGGVNTELRPVPVNMDVIDHLEEYGLNKEYAIKWVELNRHNSVTSTYYLLIKNKKREVVTELIKQGKKFDDVERNEKQQLISLLEGLGKSKDKANKHKMYSQNIKTVETDQKEQDLSEKDPANITKSKFQKWVLKPLKIPDDPIEILEENIQSKGVQLKKKTKNRNESVDAWTRNRKLKKKNGRQPMNDSKDDQMEEIITSGRDHYRKISPSPSPEKYDILPQKEERL